MYIPPYFAEKDLSESEALVREFGFATLVSMHNNLPWATHLPLELEIEKDNWLLFGHIGRANPQWKNFGANADVLAIFMGPHTYVSPSWYNHKNVPTWNYRAVHLYGKARIIEGEELRARLRKMMARYENAHAEHPLKFDEIPEDLLQSDLRALTGFEIKVERIDSASKLSQNRDAESFQSIIDHLNKSGAYDSKRIAEEMSKRKSKTDKHDP